MEEKASWGLWPEGWVLCASHLLPGAPHDSLRPHQQQDGRFSFPRGWGTSQPPGCPPGMGRGEHHLCLYSRLAWSGPAEGPGGGAGGALTAQAWHLHLSGSHDVLLRITHPRPTQRLWSCLPQASSGRRLFWEPGGGWGTGWQEEEGRLVLTERPASVRCCTACSSNPGLAKPEQDNIPPSPGLPRGCRC